MDAYETLLKAFEQDPQNDVMLDRILSLLRNDEDGTEKQQTVLHLARILVSVDPKQSLELAKMVLNYSGESQETFDIIIDSFKQMRRYAMVEFVQAAKEKFVQKKQSPNKITQVSYPPTDEAPLVSDIQTEFVSQIETLQTQKVNFTNIAIFDDILPQKPLDARE